MEVMSIHHVIIVTFSNFRLVQQVHAKALELFGHLVSPVVMSIVNSYCSFAVFPDGSYEDYSTSIEGDIRRHLFKDYLNTLKHSNGNSPLEWVEVKYGKNANPASVTACSDITVFDTDKTFVL